MTTNNKTITSAINKKFLTPCRRIGLSRNRKRTNSDFKSPLADANEKLKDVISPAPAVGKVNESHIQESATSITSSPTTSRNKEINTSDEKNLKNEVHPKKKRINKKEEIDSTFDQNLKKEPNDNNLLKENVALKVETKDVIPEEGNKRKRFKEKCNLNEDLPIKNNIVKTPKQVIKRKKVCVLDSDSDDSVMNDLYNKDIKDDSEDIDTFVVNKTETTPKNYSKKRKIRVMHSDSEGSEQTNISTTRINESKDERRKLVVRLNSDSIGNISNDEINKPDNNEFRIIKKIHRNPSYLQDIQEDETVNFESIINDKKEIYASNNQRKKSIKRKLSLKRDTSKSEAVLSDNEFLNVSNSQKNPSQSNLDTTKLIDDIVKLEKRVNDKEIELERLKHAEIYKKLHKIEDLERETDVWKTGCQNALIDLLRKLREHACIDMEGMLKNLKMPPNLFSFDNENDCFI